MPTSRLTLLANDADLAKAIQGHLLEHLGQTLFQCGLADLSTHLNLEGDGLLFVAAGGHDDEEAVLRLVQDICLQKLPTTVVLIEGGQLRPDRFQSLDPYVYRRVHWPKGAGLVLELAKAVEGEAPGAGRGARCEENGRFPALRVPRSTSTAPQESLERWLQRRLLAQTPSLVSMVDRIALAARHEVTVLLTGETGTGKTFLARLIHEHSPRKDQRFLNVACGALSANLVESEFFGHAKGAFTGADRAKVGKFAAVGQGTLLLDEIDTLGLEQQATLLRVIETGEFEPVGSNETQTCHGRLIVTSNVDLEKAVQQQKFRLDLYYRLNVMSFHLPPLRERVEDISPLARGMAARFNRKFKKNLFDISPEAIAVLEAFSWPGNLRQLENVVQQAVLVSSGAELLVKDLPGCLLEKAPHGNGLAESPGRSLHQQRDLTERAAIQKALVAHGNSRSQAADYLGISRVTLYKKMKKYGLMEKTSRSLATPNS